MVTLFSYGVDRDKRLSWRCRGLAAGAWRLTLRAPEARCILPKRVRSCLTSSELLNDLEGTFGGCAGALACRTGPFPYLYAIRGGLYSAFEVEF